jgi:hypothetical protein
MRYELKPKIIEAFEWNPDRPNAEWFDHMIRTGQAYEIIGSKRDGTYARVSNKRGDYKALSGDYICRDEYGHIYVWSNKTFLDRVTPL